MDNLQAITQAFWIFGSIATVVLAVRLWFSGLAVVYRSFFAFLCFTIARDLFLRAVTLPRDVYAYFYMFTQAVVAFLMGLVIAELFSLVLRQYPAIRTVSRWALLGIVIVCAVGGSLLFYLQATAAAKLGPQWRLPLFFAAERSVYIALTASILLGTLVLTWYPIRLPRNVVVHFFLFTTYFLCKALSTLIRAYVTRQQYALVDVAWLGLSGLLVVTWAVLLKPSGEHVDVVVGHRWNPGDQEKLLTQLEGINSALARAGQR
ncbi:MAG: hypothetical protein HY820_34945 [Acidobacteria bacterium]|nr:hypothetical protein [Acidobacteriota bacterium]